MKAEKVRKLYSDVVIKRTYSRWDDDKQRRETWDEAVDRYADYVSKKVNKDLLPHFTNAIQYIKDKKVMPSMRMLWTAGKAADVDNVCIYNCSYTPINSLDRFHEIMYLLMNGVGVGFSVERQYITSLPIVSPVVNKEDATTYIVEDSKKGWALAYKALIRDWYVGIPSTWDVSKIRPKGSLIKTFGGRASGSGVLVDLFNFTRKTIFKAAGRKLNSIEVADIVCKIADIVICGGVRRSACIAFSNLSDPRMSRFKEGQFWIDNPQRALANISVAYTEKPGVASYMTEFLQLYQSGTGERGFANVTAYPDDSMRLNPCQPEYAKVLTPNGISTIGKISVGDKIWSEDGWVTVINKVHSGFKDVYKYETTFGSFIGTNNHKIVSKGEKVEVGNALSIDVLQGDSSPIITINPKHVIDGLLIGDGSWHKASNKPTLYIGQNDHDYFKDEVADYIGEQNGIHKPYTYNVVTTLTEEELPPIPNRNIPKRFIEANYNTVASFLRGLYSANGSVVRDRITLASVNKQLIQDVQTMLSSIGIRSYYTTTKARAREFVNGTYLCKESYELNITRDCDLFITKIGFIQSYRQEKALKLLNKKRKQGSKSAHIIKKTYEETTDVFDITVDGASHTYWSNGLNVSNCGERVLFPQQLCNLTEVVVDKDITYEELSNRVCAAVLLGTLQASYTKFDTSVLSQAWVDNTVRDALLGVSLTGTSNSDIPDKWLEMLKKESYAYNTMFAKLLGINEAKGITCNKPSGTVSQVVGCPSGIHPDFSEYYIRRIRVAKIDPLCKFLMAKQVPHNPEVGTSLESTDTIVFSFPLKSTSHRIASEVSAIDQLNYYLKFKKFWCDERGNPSCTVYVKDDEWLRVQAWVYENWDSIGGVTFLPYDDNVYQLAPYEAIDEATFNKLIEEFPEFDIEELSKYELNDNTTGAKTLSCTAGACELV